jgi:hypothetical protein
VTTRPSLSLLLALEAVCATDAPAAELEPRTIPRPARGSGGAIANDSARTFCAGIEPGRDGARLQAGIESAGSSYPVIPPVGDCWFYTVSR